MDLCRLATLDALIIVNICEPEKNVAILEFLFKQRSTLCLLVASIQDGSLLRRLLAPFRSAEELDHDVLNKESFDAKAQFEFWDLALVPLFIHPKLFF